jgi:hypothetical protein
LNAFKTSFNNVSFNQTARTSPEPRKERATAGTGANAVNAVGKASGGREQLWVQVRLRQKPLREKKHVEPRGARKDPKIRANGAASQYLTTLF